MKFRYLTLLVAMSCAQQSSAMFRYRKLLPKNFTARSSMQRPINKRLFASAPTSNKSYSFKNLRLIPAKLGAVGLGSYIEYERGKREVLGEYEELENARKHAQELLQIDPTASILLADDPIQWLEQEEQECWNEFEKFGISKDLVEDNKQAMGKQFEKDLELRSKVTIPISPRSKNGLLINAILEQHNLNPKNILILQYEMLSNPAAAVYNGLLINKAILNSFSKQSRQGIIAHEIQHIFFDDFRNSASLSILLDSYDIPEMEIINSVERYDRFRETRADLYAHLKKKNYAIGAREGFKKMLYIFGESLSHRNHPLWQTRIVLAEQIIRQHEKIEKEIDRNLNIQPSWL